MHSVRRKFSTLLKYAILPAAAVVALAGPVNAAVFDTSLVAPGVYFGTGNANEYFVTNTASNIELGLGTLERFVTPIAPITSTSSTYNVMTGTTTVAGKTGAAWDFEFSINTNANGTGDGTLAGITSSLCVQDVGAGTKNCFDPLAIPDDAHASSATAQNAEALQFLDTTTPTDTRFFDPAFNINANDTYIFTLSAFNADRILIDTVRMTDIAGTGAVPEPVSLSLFGMGIVGLGLVRRRKDGRRTQAI